MDKQSTLRYIAETGYNVGFGAKKHFATFDIVDKVPGIIGFLSMAVGVFALIVPVLSTQHVSATLIVFGILALYVSFYNPHKQKYDQAGRELTEIFNNLKAMYFSVKSNEDSIAESTEASIKELEERFDSASISKQILFSDWYAHYKFFWQHQIDWIDEEIEFSFLRDKVPLTLTITAVLLALIAIVFVGWQLLKSS